MSGRVLDEDGRPIRGALLEVWQANAAGRYRHEVDNHPAPLDPNFSGAGRCLTDDEGNYRFVTIKPGAYPWGNHENAWRPAHIHFSLFGRAFTERLVTQMYFPGDPLFAYDPIFNAVRDPNARALLVSQFDLSTTVPDWALGYRWDIVLGRGGTAPPPWRQSEDSVSDRRAVLLDRPVQASRATNWCPRAILLRCDWSGASSTATAPRFPMEWSSSGTPPGSAGAEAAHATDGAFSFVVAKPSAAPGVAPHLEVLSSHAASCGISGHASTSRTKWRPMPRTRSCRRSTEADRARLVAEADEGGIRFDIHLQGPLETIFFTS